MQDIRSKVDTDGWTADLRTAWDAADADFLPVPGASGTGPVPRRRIGPICQSCGMIRPPAS